MGTIYTILAAFSCHLYIIDSAQMEHALEPGRVTFDEKMVVRKAIQQANIPYTYISSNCYFGYFVGNLSQMETLLPPKDKFFIYGHGNAKGNTFFAKLFHEHSLWQFLIKDYCRKPEFLFADKLLCL